MRAVLLLCWFVPLFLSARGIVVPLGDDLLEATYAVRFRLPASGETALWVGWGADSVAPAAHTTVRFADSAVREHYGAEVAITICDSVSGYDERFKRVYELPEQEFSIVLRFLNGGVSVSMGDGAESFVASLKQAENPRDIVVAYTPGVEVARHHLISRTAGSGDSVMPALTYAEIMERIKQTTDSIEGVWSYLDRDLNASKAVLKTKYCLATVRETDGYAIYALKGSKARHKGFLRPTPFADHFDLLWHAADGTVPDDEAYANAAVSQNVLQLVFPKLGSQVRFAKQMRP